MAEILINQHLVDEARQVLDELRSRSTDNKRIDTLSKRIDDLSAQTEPVPSEPRGEDAVRVTLSDEAIQLMWELTGDGLDLARAYARYSGRNIVRLFSAVPGPRGVRTLSRDIDIKHAAATLVLHGLPRPAVHVAAVGFLANTGLFVPLAQSEPLAVAP